MLKAVFTAFRTVAAWLAGDAPEPSLLEQADGGMMPQQEENSLTWLINLIVIIPTLIIAFYIWKQFLSEWITDFRDAVVSLIQRFRAKRQSSRAYGASDGEYTDTESDVTPQPRQKRRMKLWMKQFRSWQQLPDRPEKFYAGYQLFLTAPVWTDVPQAADTARELCEKWRVQMPDDASFDAPTAALEQDRYAMDGLPDSACAALNAALINIAKKRV